MRRGRHLVTTMLILMPFSWIVVLLACCLASQDVGVDFHVCLNLVICHLKISDICCAGSCGMCAQLTTYLVLILSNICNAFLRLLTPPGTPRVPALDAAEKAPPSTVTKRTVTRSSSTTRASRVGKNCYY